MEKQVIWNKGFKLGLFYMFLAAVIYGLTLQDDPDGPLVWLGRFSVLTFIIPLFAAQHAYKAGIDDARSSAESQD